MSATGENQMSVDSPDGEPLFAGIRYASRVDGKECWAIFDRTPVEVEGVRVIYQTDAALERVARRRNLTIM
jgi:hypothetical protein